MRGTDAGIGRDRCGRKLPAGRALWAAGLLVVLLLAGSGTPGTAAPVKAAGGVLFTYSDPAAGQVSWAGEWNGWNMSSHPMTRDAQGVWSIVIPLGPGEHAYKLVIDGTWTADPENPVTKGEFGNSIVTVLADGSLGAAAAASGAANTPYSAKIRFDGRFIGLYKSSLNRSNDRYELRRPELLFDLNTSVRMSDLLRARFLLKVNSEAEALEYYRTRLILDRGSLEFIKPGLEIFAYDNEDAGTWDDPLRLVGGVGIYDYAYGYDRQGFRFRPQFLGFEAELHYADNFEAGGTGLPPPLPLDADTLVVSGLAVQPDGSGGYVLAPVTISGLLNVNVSDNNEDMLALRLKRDLGDFTVGALARSDRGFNLGVAEFAYGTGPTTFGILNGANDQLWYALGGEVRWRGSDGLETYAEYLYGEWRMDFTEGTVRNGQVDSVGADGVTDWTLFEESLAENESLTLDVSHRLMLGGRWTTAGGDQLLEASAEYMSHDYGERIFEFRNTTAVKNSAWVGRLQWDRDWRHYLDRQVRTGLGVEWWAFDYDSRTPWTGQLWFPNANFWLEADYDEVSYDRLVMLGGNDLLSFRPKVTVPILAGPNLTFEYEGLINTVDLATRPRYIESLFRLGYDFTPALRLQGDTRWVKYDDPVLGLGDGYVSHFVELGYSFAPGVQIALSYGVDPWVLDPKTNQYASRGRDDFLFARGANSTIAAQNFAALQYYIPQAERALRDERRIQVEAIVRF